MNDIFTDIDPTSLPLRAQVAAACVGGLILAGLCADVVLLLRVARRPFNPDETSHQLRTRPWTGHDAAFVLLSLGTLFLVMQMAASFIAQYASESVADVVATMQTLLFHVVSVLLAFALVTSRGITWFDGFGLTRDDWRRRVAQGALYYLAALPFVTLYALVSALVLHLLNYPAEQQDVIEMLCDAQEPLWFRGYLVMLAIVTAPLVEELLFRGLALPALAKRFGTSFAVLAVSFLFALIHGNVASLAPLFAFAVALSIAYMQTGSLLVPITMHTLFNGVSLVILLLFRDALPQTVGTVMRVLVP
jgi:membrane protease YdiL (CAAX protease family)